MSPSKRVLTCPSEVWSPKSRFPFPPNWQSSGDRILLFHQSLIESPVKFDDLRRELLAGAVMRKRKGRRVMLAKELRKRFYQRRWLAGCHSDTAGLPHSCRSVRFKYHRGNSNFKHIQIQFVLCIQYTSIIIQLIYRPFIPSRSFEATSF